MTPPHGIDLAAFAAISADLAEGDRPFSDVLSARSLTEDQWTSVSVFWAQHLDEHAIEFSDAFAQAQDAKRPLIRLSVSEWYELGRAIDGIGLARALAQRSLGLADYSRLIRHWAREIATNAEVRSALADLGNREDGV